MAKKKKAAVRKSVSKKAPTKSEIYNAIAAKTDLSRKQVASVCDEMGVVIRKSLRGAGSFTIPGLCKMTVVKKPARKARKGINPFTGEETMFKAKPASKAIRIRPLKNLKEMVA